MEKECDSVVRFVMLFDPLEMIYIYFLEIFC